MTLKETYQIYIIIDGGTPSKLSIQPARQTELQAILFLKDNYCNPEYLSNSMNIEFLILKTYYFE